MCVSVLIAVMSESISTHLGLRFCYPWIQKLMPAAGYWTPAKSSLWEGHLSGLLKRYAFHCCSYDIINKIRHYRNETVISYILCKHFFFEWEMVIYSGKHCRNLSKIIRYSFFLIYLLIFIILAFWTLPKLTWKLDGTFLQYFRTAYWSNTEIVVNVKTKNLWQMLEDVQLKNIRVYKCNT